VTAPSVAPAAAPPAAVLWDMDGTLVDTEPYWMAAEHALVAEFGGTWTDDDARSVIGFDLLDTAAVLRRRGGVDLDPERIVERLLDDVIARVRVRTPWRPGALQLLSALNERGVPCALVTMSWTRLAEAVLDGLPPTAFHAVVTGDTVLSGKPHPEPYLTAAAALGVDPVDCVAIEDSPTGAESAGVAGCVVLAVRNHVAIDDAPGRVIVPSLVGIGVEELGSLVATTPVAPPPPLVPPDDKTPAQRDRRRRRGVLIGLGAAATIAIVAATMAGDDEDDGGAVTPVSEPVPAPESLELHAWAPYWALEEALPDLETRARVLHELSPFWFEARGVDDIGRNRNTPVDDADRFLETATAAGVPIVASIQDATGAGEMAAILADPQLRARHVDAVVAFAADGDFAGIDLDYEQFAFADGRDTWPETRPNWVTFVTELAARLHADGRTLTVSVPPVYDTRRTSRSGYWVYDYGAIAPVVDRIRVMAYDYSNAGSDPGPIAPLDWVRRIIAGTTKAAGDPSKLVLGVPLYGYNWPTATSGDCPNGDGPGVTTVTARGVDELARERNATPVHDRATGEWSFVYELVLDDGATSCTQLRQVNYLAADGIQQRAELALGAGLSGVSFFALGYEDDATWGVVDAVNSALADPGQETTVPS
jgi:HAD superfamily hydrolase (TIGR01509 family)